MKKYLMTGTAALAIGAAFVSCSHEVEQLSQEELQQIEIQKIKANYEQAFIKTFGQPASNQDWGFGAANARTRTAFPNSNEWDNSYKVPKAITAGERDTVMTYFRTTKNPQSETVDIRNYFVQHVGYTDTTYTTTYKKDGRDERVTITNPGRSNMDYIFVGPGYEATAWNDPTPKPITSNDGDDHVFNLNAGSGEIQLILYSGSEYFGYHDSYGTGYSTTGHSTGKYCEVNRNFVIRFIEHGGQVDCYVGFNYESGKTSEGWRLAPDEYFSDRVIKLVPGNGKWTSDADLRIIAEDLSVGDGDEDFDFNDVVFDVYYGEKGQAKAKILAAGGTLQLTVDGQEVHDLFATANPGKDCAGKMINTNGTQSADANVRSKSLDGLTAPEITFKDFAVKTPADARDNIVIKVYKNGNWIELDAVIGKVASKVRVGTDYTWKNEREYVGDNFKDFVAGQVGYTDWYKQPQP